MNLLMDKNKYRILLDAINISTSYFPVSELIRGANPHRLSSS
jgi:hypothetical protein